ncbi:MAG: type 1 glutamine amidotransferase [Nocardiopsaceae bacterium]|nr:type 1 glutamine amidotransferase [Nocardiopsaceae bacterium]
MASDLTGTTIAFLVAPEGTEQVELTDPWQAVENAGGTPRLISVSSGEIQAVDHLDKADTFPVDATADQVSAADFTGLVLPGGVANPDRLRTHERAVAFVKEFFDTGKPVAAICHAPWTLIEADTVRGRRLTSYPSLKTDVANAGGEWVDEEVVTCAVGPNTLITSRGPGDLPAFSRTALDAFAR